MGTIRERGMKDVPTTKFNTVATNEECFFA